ncbi:unnamed protein product [Alopecurus aequalis]
MGSEREILPDGLDDNILSEILLRLPPQPSSLPRASAVCKRWHNVVCNPGFCRRFRRHHRRNAPLLGFFDPSLISFVPTLHAPNRVLPGRFSLLQDRRHVSCGSRHGLLLILEVKEPCRHILVWDPVSGDQGRVDIPPEFEKGRNHRRGDANLWGDIISMQLSHKAYMMRFTFDNLILNPGVLVGDSLYRELDISGILEFDLKRKSLDVIRVPVIMYIDRFSVIRDEGGGLGFLYLIDFTAQLWRRKTDSDGVASWVLGRTIELDNLLSLDPNQHVRILVQGFAEENNLVFLSTVIGLFLVQLQSLHFTFMEHSEYNFMYHPFESVYTAV